MIDLANRTIRHGVVGFQYQIAQNVFNRDTNGINSYQRSVRMEGAALRLRTRTLLIGISGILRLLGMNSTGNKSCLLCKAAHRLGKKDENCAKAQRKKWTFAGDCHGCFPYLMAAALSTTASRSREMLPSRFHFLFRNFKI